MVYYNENDPFAAEWLRALIAAGQIAEGWVDERDIRDVQAEDLERFRQCHYFAGIGTWSYALRLAGVPDDAPVWTGSCPCQPFSGAGKRKGVADERHLWPEWFRLIRECRPPVCFGEQVASPDGLHWLDLVSSDLEGAAYAIGAADLCAAGVGAPHIRQRLFFVADTNGGSRGQGSPINGARHPRGDALARSRFAGSGLPGVLGDPEGERYERSARAGREAGGVGLNTQAGWMTPTARDWRDRRASPETMAKGARPLNEQAVQLAASGATPNGSSAETASGVQLNPALSRWLIGLPAAWDVCAVTAMRLLRRLRRNSSRRISKREEDNP